MEEINDLARIISVSMEGMRLGAVATKESLKMLGRFIKTLYCAIEYDRVRSGKARGMNPVKKMKKMDPNVSFVKISKENLKQFEKLARKHGVYYTEMPSYSTSKNQDVVHIMFHTSSSPSMESVLEMLRAKNFNELDGKESIEEYITNSGIDTLTDKEFTTELDGKYPKQYKELTALSSQSKKNKTAEEKTKEALAENTLLEKRKSKDNRVIYIDQSQIIKENRDEYMIRTNKEDDSYIWMAKSDIYVQNDDVVMGIVPKEKELRLTNFDETEHYTIKGEDLKHYMDSRYEPITITKQIIREETETQYMTRIPSTKGKEFLWVDKSNASEEHNGKSIKTYLDKNASYQVVDKDNNFVRSIAGRELYSQHYDPFKEKVSTIKGVAAAYNKKTPVLK